MRLWVVALTLLALGASAEALVISEVRHSRRSFDPAVGEAVEISFRLSAAAEASVHFYDGRDLEIRRVDLGSLEAGVHRASWDGNDASGRSVPAEAYTYAISASNGTSEAVRWDLGHSGGDRVFVHDLRWDSDAGLVRYRIGKPARVQIRIGMANDGPLLRTLLDWVPRSAGVHEEPWDGTDSAAVFDLANHPHLALAPNAFALPPNTVLVEPPPRRVELITGLSDGTPRRPKAESSGPHRMFAYARQPIEKRRDFPVRLQVADVARRTADGRPVVQGRVAFRLDVAEEDRAWVLSQRAEAVFYVDGQLVFERETGFLPMSWTWDASGLSPGLHYITANLRGYEGFFGMTTIAVVVGDGANE